MQNDTSQTSAALRNIYQFTKHDPSRPLTTIEEAWLTLNKPKVVTSTPKIYTGVIEVVYNPIPTSTGGTQQKVLVKNARDVGKTMLLLCDLNENMNFVVGHTITARGVILSHTWEGIDTLCPTTESLGYVRYNGKVAKWFTAQ